MLTTSTFHQYLHHPELLNESSLYDLRIMLNHYPYSQALRMLYLQNLYLLHDSQFGVELRRSIACFTDRTALFRMVEGYRYQLKPESLSTEEDAVVDKAENEDRTLSLIDSFLSDKPDESADLELEAIPYTLDYTSLLEKETGAEPEKVEEPAGKTPENIENGEEPFEDENFFTETLAKIYVKQHRYERALEILNKLSLNYPKKSAYFADQIRFLEKLIINEKTK